MRNFRIEHPYLSITLTCVMRAFSIIFITVCLLAPGHLLAQYKLDFGLKLGGSNYVGDMTGILKAEKKQFARHDVTDIRRDQTHFAGGVWIRYKFHPRISGKLNLMYGRISGADSLTTYRPRTGRNLSFRSDVFEMSAQAEYMLFGIRDITGRGRVRVDFTSYVHAGLGIFHHNPKAFYQGKWYPLQPLGTEGQGRLAGVERYGLIQATIPYGVGFYYTIKRKFRIGVEYESRITFTDYLDDISTTYVDPAVFSEDPVATSLANRSYELQNNPEFLGVEWYQEGSVRGDDKFNDKYMFLVVSLGYVIRGKGAYYKTAYRLNLGNNRGKRKKRAKF